jgi:hypothetical protein
MPSKDQDRWRRLAALEAKREIPCGQNIEPNSK